MEGPRSLQTGASFGKPRSITTKPSFSHLRVWNAVGSRSVTSYAHILICRCRICPGKDIANRAGLYLSTTIMAVFNILPLEGKLAPDSHSVEYNTQFIR